MVTYKNEHEKAMEDIPNYLGNPINAFTLIKRLTTDLDYIERSIEVGTGMIILFYFNSFFPASCCILYVCRLCVLSGGTQRRAFSRHQSVKIKILNISFPLFEIKPTTCRIFITNSFLHAKN